jgi:hypothetical protein
MYWNYRHSLLLILGAAALAFGLGPSCDRQKGDPVQCGHMAFIDRGHSDADTRPCPGKWIAGPTGPWYRCECVEDCA